MAGKYLRENNNRIVSDSDVGSQSTTTEEEQSLASIDARFYRLACSVQPILYLARLFSDCIKRAWIARRITPRGAPKLILEAQVVPCRASYLCHIDI
jgi:hypothetical protein